MIRVLIVDDEPDISDSCALYLENNGYDARSAKNAAEAYKELEEYRPQIALLDINLRERVTGVNILESAVEKYPDIKVVMFTGLGDEDVKQKCLDAGAKMIVEKPVVITRIKEIVDELSRGISAEA